MLECFESGMELSAFPQATDGIDVSMRVPVERERRALTGDGESTLVHGDDIDRRTETKLNTREDLEIHKEQQQQQQQQQQHSAELN